MIFLRFTTGCEFLLLNFHITGKENNTQDFPVNYSEADPGTVAKFERGGGQVWFCGKKAKVLGMVTSRVGAAFGSTGNDKSRTGPDRDTVHRRIGPLTMVGRKTIPNLVGKSRIVPQSQPE